MSKKGKKEINIKKKKILIKIYKKKIKVIGKKGIEKLNLKKNIILLVINKKIILRIQKNKNKNFWGTYFSYLKNLIKGVTKKFKKILLIEGIGYKCEKKNKNLKIKIGFSENKYIKMEKNINYKIDKNKKKITIKGTNKVKIGDICEKIKRIRKYNAYKKKGIRDIKNIPIQKSKTKK